MSSNRYQKDGCNRKELPPIAKSKEPALVTNPVAITAPVGYSKEAGERSPALFVIVVGGTKRELLYFNPLKKFPRIKVEVIYEDPKRPRESGLPPKRLYDVATAKKEELRDSALADDRDRFYLVSDVDEFMSQLLEIKPKCEAEHFKLIVSNPCFEIWLYYGKCVEKPPHDFDIPTDAKKISKSFKTYLGERIEGGIDSRKAINSIKTANKNARTVYEEDGNGIPTLFSTAMFLLAEDLLPLIGTDIGVNKTKSNYSLTAKAVPPKRICSTSKSN
ncbi:MAG: RloB family protein [Planctomycetota bacterium]|jgi:hypothetical protein|nr:RloB family protein [Planctomycetota bacterium]